MRHTITLLAVALTLAGCATTAGYKATLDTWIGSRVDNLIYKWGYPVSSFEAPSGNTVYVYQTSRNYTTPMYATTNKSTSGYNTYVAGGQNVHKHCTTWFEIDKESQEIIHWRYEGNDCIAPMPGHPMTRK